MKKAFLFVAITIALFTVPTHAQMPDEALRDTASQIIPGEDTTPAKVVLHDTTVSPAPGPIIPADNIGGVPVPAWLQTIIIALGTILPAVQLVLKRIPTAQSVRITGVVGKILDVMTFFQKDKGTTISSTAPPAVQNGAKTPASKDLQNHA